MATNHPRRRAQVRAGVHPVSKQNNTRVPGFDEAIGTAEQRLATLRKQAVGASEDQKHILSKTFQELQITLEELQVADAELRQQNEELVIARQLAEVERQRYHALFDFAPDAYLVTDAAALIQEANQAAAALLGVAKHRLRGKPLILFIEPAEQRAFCDHLTSLSRRGEARTWEVRLQPRRGVPLYVAVTTRVSRDAQGQRVGLRWLLHDISARKAAQERAQQAEQALQHSREQLRALATHLREQQEEELALDQARATGMFRIFQEALTNVLRHASAREVMVRLVPLPNTLVLEVADDGKGITSGQLADRNSLGLLSMRERAHLLGGDVTILGKAGEGTIVCLRVPYGEQPGARGFG
jgi:PAS domain S-box-containing protein